MDAQPLLRPQGRPVGHAPSALALGALRRTSGAPAVVTGSPAVRCGAHRDLVLAYDFDDPQELDRSGRSRPRLTARDVSGNGNELPLITLPVPSDIVIEVSIRVVTSIPRPPQEKYTSDPRTPSRPLAGSGAVVLLVGCLAGPWLVLMVSCCITVF